MRPSAQWIIFFAIIAAVAFTGWYLSELVLYKLALLAAALLDTLSLHAAVTWLPWFVIDGALAVEMFLAGFLYLWFIEPDWRKAGAVAWMLFIAIHVVAHLDPAATSLRLTLRFVPFYAGAAIGLAAALYGAWWAEENRTNQKVRLVMDSLLGVIGL